ncbi:hypothetical protein DFH06DRAFT_1349798 [Mycena polygramma]|nr:hypothetical protein DFH06DRAFT_1349798 [Mycena polygramma]
MSPTASAALTISSLPNELLAVVAAAGQEGRVADSNASFDCKSEWTLSQVSRRFRQSIVGAPSLWTLLEVNFDAEGSIEISKLYLARSRACPIRVTILSRSHIFSIEKEDLITRNFIPHIARVWWLRFEVGTESPHLTLSPFQDVAAPNLQHLEIVKDTRDVSTSQGYFEVFSLGAPKLSFVKTIHFNPIRPQWMASVTHLEFWGSYCFWDYETRWKLLFDLTAQCPLLAHFRLDVAVLPERARKFHIPSLKTLHLMLSGGLGNAQFILHVFDLFDTRALTDLTLAGTHGDEICTLFNATGLEPPFPSLASLSFIRLMPCSCADEDEFESTLYSPPVQLFPALSSLALINQCFMHKLVVELLQDAELLDVGLGRIESARVHLDDDFGTFSSGHRWRCEARLLCSLLWA